MKMGKSEQAELLEVFRRHIKNAIDELELWGGPPDMAEESVELIAEQCANTVYAMDSVVEEALGPLNSRKKDT